MYSFENWCLDTDNKSLLNLWDTGINKIQPNEISYGSNKTKIYFKCPNGIHASSAYYLNNLTKSESIQYHKLCKGCNSIGQYLCQILSSNDFNKICDINECDLYTYARNSNKRIKLQCHLNHPVFESACSNIKNKIACPYCAHKKIVSNQSLGCLYPDSISVWSPENIDTPFNVAPHSDKQVLWLCPERKHDNFLRKISASVNYGFKCPECSREQTVRYHDLTGQQFGRLTVIERDNTDLSGVRWVCMCSCGQQKSILASHLTSGKIVSCGCYWKEKISGENNHSWKGGITPLQDQARTNGDAKAWTKAVYRKDFYTCQCCGESIHIKKNAHHMKNFSDHIESRYDIDNGITLCSNCHSHTVPGSFHSTYGTIHNTECQLEEYINNKRNQLGITVPFSIERYYQGERFSPQGIIMIDADIKDKIS